MKLDQVETRRIIDILKGQVDQTWEFVIAMSNLQHIVAEIFGPSSGFIAVTNPTYDLPYDFSLQQMEVPTRPQSVHILISNEVLMVKKTPLLIIMNGILNSQ